MDSRKPLTAGELEIDCGAFGKIRRASPPAKGDFAIKDGRLTLLGCIQRGLVTLSREELFPFLDAMDAQEEQIQTLNERIIELDLEAMEKCRRVDSLLTPPPDAAVREAVEYLERLRHSLLTTVGPEFTSRIDTISRAVQAPRLTPKQMEAVRFAERRAEVEPLRAMSMLRAAFPEAFAGEVGRGE